MGTVVKFGGVLSVRAKVAEVVSKLLQPSPAINSTVSAESQLTLDNDGLDGDVLQMIALQSSSASAPPCELIQLLKTVAILLWLQSPKASEAGVMICGATVLVTVKVRSSVLILLQLSMAVNSTSMTPQNDVIVAGLGALSESDMMPQPLSVAVKLARWVLSQVVYCAMAVAHRAEPFCRLLVINGGVLSGNTLIVWLKEAELPSPSSAIQVRVIVPPVHGAALPL